MGALTPVMTGLTTLVGIADTAMGAYNSLTHDPVAAQRQQLRAQQDLALRQLQQRQAHDLQIAGDKAALERSQIAASAQADDERRRAALKRAVARQRASFGAQGMGGATGSAEAVLLGLFDESDQDRAQRERLDQIRLGAVDQALASRNQLNILQRSQLQERQKLERELLG